MSPMEDVIPVPAEFLRPELAVADVVYNPKETLLIKRQKKQDAVLPWEEAACFSGRA